VEGPLTGTRDALLKLRRWSPSPVLRASLWLHALGAVTILAHWPLWPLVLALLGGNHLLLTAGMHPRGAMLGPNLRRLPPAGATRGRVVLTFDDGPHPDVTPRVLDILEAHGATASFFVIGRLAALHPALLREIIGRGHDVENHTQRHSYAFACMGPWRQAREIREAQRAVADACGRAPRFFRAPMGLRNPLLAPVLHLGGLSLVSWTRRGYDTRLSDRHRILRRLTRNLADGDILLLHDGSSALDAAGEPVVLAVLPELLERIAAAGLSASSLRLAIRAEPAGAASPAPAVRA